MSACFGTARLRVVDQRDVDRPVLVGQLCVCELQCWCVYELIYTYRILVARARLRVHVCIYVHGVVLRVRNRTVRYACICTW